MSKKKEDAIGMLPSGEIEQYAPGDVIPPTTFRVLDEDGTETEQSLDDEGDDPFFESDDDLDLGDDDEEDDE